MINALVQSGLRYQLCPAASRRGKGLAPRRRLGRRSRAPHWAFQCDRGEAEGLAPCAFEVYVSGVTRVTPSFISEMQQVVLECGHNMACGSGSVGLLLKPLKAKLLKVWRSPARM